MEPVRFRYFIQLSFEGTSFHGWQIQPNANSVQETLNTSLTTMLREEVYTVGAGRTDTGVHAKEMFAHFEVSREIQSLEQLTYRMNKFLPTTIAIQKIFLVGPNDHARFSAVKRGYRYYIDTQKNPFQIDKSWYFSKKLDLQLMNKAANLLLAIEDFKAFAKAGHQSKTTLCHVEHAQWEEIGGQLVFTIQADRFLRNMVRAIVGTLVEVGLGKMNFEEFKKIISEGERSDAGVSAPACGLYLDLVEYPEGIVK